MNTIENLKEIFESQFAHEVPGFGIDTTPADIDAWDSTAHVLLVLAIESRFGIEFTPTELGKMGSVGEICKLVEAKVDA